MLIKKIDMVIQLKIVQKIKDFNILEIDNLIKSDLNV